RGCGWLPRIHHRSESGSADFQELNSSNAVRGKSHKKAQKAQELSAFHLLCLLCLLCLFVAIIPTRSTGGTDETSFNFVIRPVRSRNDAVWAPWQGRNL